jgi:3-oxoacyl-[acyl-carrier-protein] synthase-3
MTNLGSLVPPGVAIQTMAATLPARVQTLSQAAEGIGLTSVEVKMFGRLFGLKTLPFDPSMSLQTMLGDTYEALRRKAPEDVARARYVIHCHTIPSVRRPGAGLGLDLPVGTEEMSLTMAHCASGLFALDLLPDMLNDDETAVILVGEKAFHSRIRLVKDTTIMSEGAVAILVCKGQGRWPVVGTHVTHAGACAVSRGHPNEDPQLVDDYIGFVSTHISAALDRFGCKAEDLAMIMPHNVNMVSWAAIAKTLGLPLAKIYTDNIGRLGHCFGADPFLNLIDADREQGFAPGDKLLCVSVGMGMTAASVLLEIPQLSIALL